MEIRQRLFVPEIREARSCLKLEFVASTCSKLLERASLDGFPVGKQEAVEQAANPSVARWKNGSLCTLNITRRLAWYGRGDISVAFASTYKVATPFPTPFTINYLFEGKAHVYLPDAIGQFQNGSLLIAEAGQKPRETPRAQSGQTRCGAQGRRTARRRLLGWDRSHLVTAKTCQSGLFACPASGLSLLART